MELTPKVEGFILPEGRSIDDYTKNFKSPALDETIAVQISSTGVKINVPKQLAADISRQKYVVGFKEIGSIDLAGLCKEVLVLAGDDVKAAEKILRMCTQASIADLAVEVWKACVDDSSGVYQNKNYHSYFNVYKDEGHLKLSVKQFFHTGNDDPTSEYSKEDIALETNIMAHVVIDFDTDQAFFFYPAIIPATSKSVNPIPWLTKSKVPGPTSSSGGTKEKKD